MRFTLRNKSISFRKKVYFFSNVTDLQNTPLADNISRPLSPI